MLWGLTQFNFNSTYPRIIHTFNDKYIYQPQRDVLRHNNTKLRASKRQAFFTPRSCNSFNFNVILTHRWHLQIIAVRTTPSPPLYSHSIMLSLLMRIRPLHNCFHMNSYEFTTAATTIYINKKIRHSRTPYT